MRSIQRAIDESNPRGRSRGPPHGAVRDRQASGGGERALEVYLEHASFEAWWEPYTLGVGPAGAYGGGLDDEARERLRERCRRALPPAPFVQVARAWAARGIAS